MMTSLRYLGWCPVCQHDIKVRGGLLVHHGYLRPGVGHIIGDCFGVASPPYELSPKTAEEYLNMVVRSALNRLKDAYGILTGPEGPPWLMFEDYDIQERRIKRDPHTRAVEMIRLSRQEADDLVAQLPGYDRDHYSWERRLRIAISNTESDIKMWSREEARLVDLVDRWVPQPLREVEEEIEKQRQTRLERQDAKDRARRVKVEAEVAKQQKRIDSAVRNKNSAALADIWESNKIREISGWELSVEQAHALLDRDRIWAAFGLLDNDDTRAVLGAMWYGVPVPLAGGGYDRGPLPWPTELGGGYAKTRR